MMIEQGHTFASVKATGECVMNIPPVGMAETVLDCGHTPGRLIDKLKNFGLTTPTAGCVKAPLIKLTMSVNAGGVFGLRRASGPGKTAMINMFSC